jgi:hypothetical protein
LFGRRGDCPKEAKAFLLSITGCEIDILSTVILLFQTCLQFEAVIQGFGHIFLVAVVRLITESVYIIGMFHFIACSLMDTLPIPMLAITTVGEVPAFA